MRERYSTDWTELSFEPDEDTLTRSEALARQQDTPAPIHGGALMRSLRLPDKRSRVWMEQAACRGLGADLFFPDDRDVKTRKDAVEVCKRCPVFDECDDYANGLRDGLKVTDKEYSGVWAGRLRGRGSKSDKPRMAVCVECGEAFVAPKRKGNIPKTCGEKCKTQRHNRQGAESYQRRKAAS